MTWDWLRRSIDELISKTEDVVDESAYVGEDGVGPEMTLAQLKVHLRQELGEGRFPAMDARHHACVSLHAFNAGDYDEAQRLLIIGYRSWVRALERVQHTKRRRRLDNPRNRAGRRSKHEDVNLFRAASQLIKVDTSLTQVEACKAALSTSPSLALAYRNVTPDSLAAAFRRGRRKSKAN